MPAARGIGAWLCLCEGIDCRVRVEGAQLPRFYSSIFRWRDHTTCINGESQGRLVLFTLSWLRRCRRIVKIDGLIHADSALLKQRAQAVTP